MDWKAGALMNGAAGQELNLNKSLQLDITGKTGDQLTTANAKFENRNYSINQYSLEPSLSFTKGTVLRFTTGYKYSNKKNQTG